MWENLRADLARLRDDTGDGSSLRVLVRGLVSQGFQAILVYRCFRWFHVRGIPTQPVRFVIERGIEILTGISIPAETEIGKGLRIHHFGGIILHSHVKMGEHCTLYHGVTLGDKGGSGEPPTVGNNVLVGAGAKVLGEITIGDNVIIGANAVVIASVPDNVIVGGVPAKILGENRKGVDMQRAQEPSQKKITVMQGRSTYSTGGGPDKTTLLIAEHANPDKFRIVLMYMRSVRDHDFAITTWAKEKELTIHEVLEYKKLDFSNFRDIHRLLRQYHIDIFHARDYKTCVIGAVLSYIHPQMKLLFTAHGWVIDSKKQRVYTWLNLFSLKRYDKIIAVSEATKQVMVANGIDPHKIVVVHNAIDVETWQRKNATPTIRQELQLPPTSKLVGFVGRLRSEKDLPTFFKVAEQVIAARPETYFLLVGDGPDRQILQHQVQQMGLNEHVRFLGFRKDTLHIYAALALFLSTSLTEGTPNTVLEALAMEVPVIHTDVGGVGELVQDGHDAIIVQPKDVHGITQAVLSVLSDEATAHRLRTNGRQTVCTKFSFASRLHQIETIYEEVMNPSA
ncbi:glycosyltransferase [candidate division KSB3 bacterium]|uniref:Glycosyltransferase n=1 Tax=candidate division KSB3 bacterium TaxID=2044937 RepID=A0A9D5JRJ9_9BACT|nr:glycosyltransferase [candidate division KSB3 bacterium]MBD3322955.1 glycosyltransferase [candidate division KSB3 bacterium]